VDRERLASLPARTDLVHDALRDVFLHLEQQVGVAVVGVHPLRQARPDVHQLDGDPEPLARASDAAVEDVGDVQPA
jgi:hypothetical protein